MRDADIMRAAMTAMIAAAVLRAVATETETAFIGRAARSIDRGREHLGGVTRNAELIQVRSPGEVREQDEEYEYFDDSSAHRLTQYPA